MPKPENLIGKGFDKRPENINRTGQNRRLISTINAELKGEGFSTASKQDITDAYLTLLNLPMSKIMEISKQGNDNYPMLYKLVAKEMLGKRGADMLEKLLDRAIGKAMQQIDHSSKDGTMSPVHPISPEAAKAISEGLEGEV